MPHYHRANQAPPTLPRPPREPDLDDCCASGCEPCIFDVYQDRLERWEARCEAIRAAHRNGQDDPADE